MRLSFSNLKSIEKYDHYLNKWKILGDMQVKRHKLDVVTKGNKCFVFCGLYINSTCKVYDSITKKFCYIAELLSYFFNPVIFGNYIVVYRGEIEYKYEK